MKQTSINTLALFEAGHTLAWPYLLSKTYPWEILGDLKTIILTIGQTLDPALYHHPSVGVWIAKSATIAPTAAIGTPTIIGENTQIRHCAYIRGCVLIGDGCVVGNSVELKNCILFDKVQVPHFNYVGDSILGYMAHLGAGAVTSNVKSDHSPVAIKQQGEVLNTDLRKLGAMVGDYVEVGCNAVLNPGCVIGKYTSIYPTASVRGVIPSHCIVKAGKGVEIVLRKST